MIQTYEDYWKITLAFTDIYGEKFNKSLEYILNFIDANTEQIASDASEARGRLEAGLMELLPIGDASTRKSINQFIKLGFVWSGLADYDPDARLFVDTTDQALKRTLFSKIVYTNSSFDRSFSNDSDKREITFLINTLTHHEGRLTKDGVAALMTLDISTIPVGYADEVTLQEAKKRAKMSGFVERKYNQIAYLWSILKHLDDITIVKDAIYFSDDPRVAQQKIDKEVVIGRDPYLQRLYKNELKAESIKYYGKVICMVEKLDFPVLVASHIKPYIRSSAGEAFDVNNGLLLSRNLDQLFDGGYISFSDQGAILISASKELSPELVEHLSVYRLDEQVMNEARQAYMDYHRQHIFVA